MRAKRTTGVKRREAIGREKKSWLDRRARSQIQTEEVEDRLAEAHEEIERLAEAPDEFLAQRRALTQKIEEAESAVEASADARAVAETERPKPSARRGRRWRR